MIFVRFREVKGRRMRRKLFFYAVILLGAVFFLETMAPDLWVPAAAVNDEKTSLHRGRVLSISLKDDHWNLTVLDERGFRVRLNLYEQTGEEWKLVEKTLEYRALLKVPDPARNPHCFDYRMYLRSQDEYLTGVIRKWKFSYDAGEDGLRHIYGEYKRLLYRLKFAFRETLPEDVRGMVMGMVFGDVGGMDEDVYEDFKKNGTAHILAVSGLHIGILYSIYEKLSGGKIGYKSIVVLCLIMYIYGTLSLWRPSVVRAELMIGMKTVAKIKELRYDSLTAMSLAAIIIVAANPYVIFGPGFQMSFLAITSINIIVKVLPEKFPQSLAQTIAVSGTMMVYQAYVFNHVAPLVFLVNIPVIYLAGIAIPLSLSCFTAFWAFTAAGAEFTGFISVPMISMTRMLIRVNSLLSFGGHTSFDVVSPPESLVIFLLTALLFSASEFAGILRIREQKGRLKRMFAIIAVVSLLANTFCYEPLSHDEIVFVDVGQGACTHIRVSKTDVLIDGGGSRTINVCEKTLKPYLLKNGAKNIDLALATHEDTDHIKGLEELEDDKKIGDLVTGSVTGDKYVLEEGVEIRTLWPPVVNGKQENGDSSCFMIDYRGVKVLVTGDLDLDGERDMVRYYRSRGIEEELKADVLNVGHHGSKYSTSDELLEAAAPSIAVIQVGRNNYGHPSEEALRRLKAHGVKLFRNDLEGAVGLDIAGGRTGGRMREVLDGLGLRTLIEKAGLYVWFGIGEKAVIKQIHIMISED